VSVFVIGLCMLVNISFNNWWQLGIMFLFISLLAIIMERFEPRVTVLPKWMHPLALGLAVTMFYTASESNGFLYDYFGPLEPMALILASIPFLLQAVFGVILKKKNIMITRFSCPKDFIY